MTQFLVALTFKAEAAPKMKGLPPLDAPTEKYLRNSIRGYFEGRTGCDLRWISDIVRSSPAHARSILETGFSQYAPTEKYRDLIGRL